MRPLDHVVLLFAAAFVVSAQLLSSLNTQHLLETRQLSAGHLPRVMRPAKTVQDLKPELDPKAKKVQFLYGPFIVPGADACNERKGKTKDPLAMDPDSVVYNVPIEGFCSDCTVLYGQSELAWENMTKADIDAGIYQHHVVILDLAKKSTPFYICPGQGFP
ncbi:hypothetical protein LTS18_000436, partial [Coniosporium uncinatum]